MKKIILLPLLVISLCADSFAATRPAARGTRGGGGTTATTSGGGAAPKTTNRGRAAVGTPAKTSAPAASTAAAPKTVNRGRAATTTTTKGPTVAARAGVTQKVIGSGTKVAAAAKNVVVNEECQQKYEGCMDAFCMMDNASGGRCMCSNKNAEYDAILAEIEKLDQQSYQMATFGVERIEMGTDADAAIAAANAAADSVLNESKQIGEDGKKTSRRTLDLSMWDDTETDLEDISDVFGSASADGFSDKTGDELHLAAANLCVAQIPECKSEIDMIKLIYSQRIKSDCTAYENSLKQQKKSSQQKLQTAERALREAALDQLKTANKYDLGQCTIEFKKCMQTTAGCGNDFAGCAVAAAMDATNVVKSTSKKTKKNSTYQIKGAITNIEISASTYDNLVAKKPLCESITKSCVAVADQVWDTFLREVAPQMKNAELIAEDNARQNCIGNISSCFLKACKDNMDPKDPDGSYDMCLTRPANMLNVCKVPLNACGIDASSEKAAEESGIWDYVLAALAAQRVDSCTTAVKECLTSEDRCGKNYTQCIGLDTDSIMRMCPYDKLTGCQKKYGTTNIQGDAVYDEIANMVQGIMLNIDNNFLTACQNALNESMIKVCGDTEDCNELTVDKNVGSHSLEYQICEIDQKIIDEGDMSEKLLSDMFTKNCKASLSQITDAELTESISRIINDNTVTSSAAKNTFAGVIKGSIDWSLVSPSNTKKVVDKNGNETDKEETVATYLKIDENAEKNLTAKAYEDLRVLQSNIESAIKTIEADPTVQFCMTGRTVQGMKVADQFKDIKGDRARFPNLTDQIRGIIIDAALRTAQNNYNQKMQELLEQQAKDEVELGNRMAKITKEISLEERRETARLSCLHLADGSILSPAVRRMRNENNGGTAKMMSGIEGELKTGGAEGKQLTASKTMAEHKYKETVTATFEWETLKCNVCTRKQQCETEKKKKSCKKWGEPTESCKTIPF